MDDPYTTKSRAGDKASRAIEAIHAQIRDAIESSDLPPKALYSQPGVSRSTVARILSDDVPSPSDQQFSTIFYLIDRLPAGQRLPVIQTLLDGWDVTVIPKRKINTDLNGDGIVDATDEREATMALLDICSRTVRHAVDAVEDGTITDNEHAISMRLRTEISRSVDVLVSISAKLVQDGINNKVKRRKARMPQGPRLASVV